LLEAVGGVEFAADGFDERGREDRIDGYSDYVFKECGDDLAEDASVDFDAGVGIGLDEERVEFVIEHEVQAKQLKGIVVPVWIEFACD
jgi:hypothetical protein